jgi:rubrerythrin
MHYALYTDAFKALNAGSDLPQSAIFVCSVCGCTVLGQPPDECPVCGAKKEKFGEVN